MRSAELLDCPTCKRQILGRLRAVRPETPRRWGKMTAPEMICHLNDCFLSVMGERPLEIPKPQFGHRLLKRIALYAPIKWPPGVKTRPELDQQTHGTRPASFDSDMERLFVLIERFTSQPRTLLDRHPIFHEMTDRDWMRWGYRHTDHHLRQFGK